MTLHVHRLREYRLLGTMGSECTLQVSELTLMCLAQGIVGEHGRFLS